MLDFIFRAGNPSNRWHRSSQLTLTAALDEPSLNGVPLGARLDRLSSLGRDDGVESGTLCYFDLGVGVDFSRDGTIVGYMVMLYDEDNEFQPYRGVLTWKGQQLDASRLTRDDLPGVFGDWYWLDSDDIEAIAFFEYPNHEVQIELAPSGAIKRFILSRDPLMADPEQREAYDVDRPWPPDYGR